MGLRVRLKIPVCINSCGVPVGVNCGGLTAKLHQRECHQEKPSPDKQPSDKVTPTGSETETKCEIQGLNPGQGNEHQQPDRRDINPFHNRLFCLCTKSDHPIPRESSQQRIEIRVSVAGTRPRVKWSLLSEEGLARERSNGALFITAHCQSATISRSLLRLDRFPLRSLDRLET